LYAFKRRSRIRRRVFDAEVSNGLDHEIGAGTRNGARGSRRPDIPGISRELLLRRRRCAPCGRWAGFTGFTLSLRDGASGCERRCPGRCVFEESTTVN
jgi:hypothetical protein